MWMHAGYAGRLRWCGFVCLAMLVGQAWSTGAEAQEAVVGAPVVGANIDALRDQVEVQAGAACSSVFRWTDDPIVPGVTPVKADHIVELRRAINDIAQGQCPALLEQVTFEGVTFTNSTLGSNYVHGFVLNSGSTSITGVRLNVRVRFFDANNLPITEGVNHLGGNSPLVTLEVQTRRPFSVAFQDSGVQDWSYFQIVAFEPVQGSNRRRVLCSGCNQRHVRQSEQVTLENVHFLDADDGYQYVQGYVLNSGSSPITGARLNVRVRFFDANNLPITEGVNHLGGNSPLVTLEVQTRRPFRVGWGDNDAPQGWDYFQVVSFEDEGRQIPCVGCDQQYPRR